MAFLISSRRIKRPLVSKPVIATRTAGTTSSRQALMIALGSDSGFALPFDFDSSSVSSFRRLRFSADCSASSEEEAVAVVLEGVTGSEAGGVAGSGFIARG